MLELTALSATEENHVCKGCGVCKPLSEFYRHPQSRDGHVQKCKTCYIQQRKNTKTSSIHGRLRETLNNAKESSRTKRREINISLKNLVALWEKQKGRCFYSGIQMTFDGVDKYRTVSLDRIDSSKGYVGDNIVLCCAIVNVMKNNLPVESFVALCENIVYWQKHRTGF